MTNHNSPRTCLECIYRDTSARRHNDAFTSAPYPDVNFCTHGNEFIIHHKYNIVDMKEIRDSRCPLI